MLLFSPPLCVSFSFIFYNKNCCFYCYLTGACAPEPATERRAQSLKQAEEGEPQSARENCQQSRLNILGKGSREPGKRGPQNLKHE